MKELNRQYEAFQEPEESIFFRFNFQGNGSRYNRAYYEQQQSSAYKFENMRLHLHIQYLEQRLKNVLDENEKLKKEIEEWKIKRK